MKKNTHESRQLEHISTSICTSSEEGSVLVAREISDLIHSRNADDRHTVLGLATGSTPIGIYRELVRLHREEGLSFKKVLTFNLDEYHGLCPSHPESYAAFMDRHLFSHIDIPADATVVPDGTVSRENVFAYCKRYEKRILEAGGIDIQVLGIGRTGHIGFNEPGSGPESRTRLIYLDSLTRKDAARDFLGEENVPRYAITMGVGTILDARKIILLAWGDSKAEVFAKAVEEPVSDALPASFLQEHEDIRAFADEAAAGELTRKKNPWLVGPVEWTDRTTRRSVAWLSSHLGKPILKLLDEDYSEHGLADLLTERGSAYELNIRVFNEVQHTITGWPGGKPNADDSYRPERAEPHPKRVLALAPDPQDGALGLGGTLHRLVDQGHEVTVAYLTSGNLSVPDGEAQKAVDIMLDLDESDSAEKDSFALRVKADLAGREAFGEDSPAIRKLKGLVRRGEARAAMEICGVNSSQIRFLNLPFYENGRFRCFETREEDIDLVRELLEQIQPHQIYVTGVLSEPTTVQAVCYTCFQKAFELLRDEDWTKDCRCWSYRGDEREWSVEAIDMAVPLSPDELANKMKGIYQHRSQRSQTPVTGRTSLEAWQQAEAADRRLAETYDHLGLAEYEAIEAFSRCNP
jgi:glucosamine-6-phosphate deaminase